MELILKRQNWVRDTETILKTLLKLELLPTDYDWPWRQSECSDLRYLEYQLQCTVHRISCSRIQSCGV